MKQFSLLLVLLLATGCSRMEGLQVLTGEDNRSAPEGSPLVADLDLVMADKTGFTDQSLLLAANRIEAANAVLGEPTVDVVEIRRDEVSGEFYVAMIYLIPNIPSLSALERSTLQLDDFRRAVEATWLATQAETDGLQTFRIAIVEIEQVTTFDGDGVGVLGSISANLTIRIDDAYAYLAGPRSLNNFQGMVADGTMTYDLNPGFGLPYTGSPNHPLIIDPTAANQ